MKLLHVLSSIAVLSISISSCGPSHDAIETAVAQTVTALPTMTSYPTAEPTLTPIPTQTPTAKPTPTREDLGVSLEQIQSMFEEYGFNFKLIRLVAGEMVMHGEYNDGVDVYLTARDSRSVKVEYGIPTNVHIDEVPIPSLGDVVVAVLGEDFYKTKFIPWAETKSGTFEESLCFDGVLIKSSYSEWSDSFELTIMLEHEWDIDFGGCE